MTDTGVGTFDGTKVQARGFLGNAEELINPDGTVVYRSASIINKYDGIGDDDGSFDNRTSGGWVGSGSGPSTSEKISDTEFLIHYSSGGTKRLTLSVPYNYEDAVALAVSMLPAVDLLNPDRVYEGIFYPAGLSAPFSGAHFCYPSEATAKGWAPLAYSNRLDGNTFAQQVVLMWATDRISNWPYGYFPATNVRISINVGNIPINGQPGGVLAQALNGMSFHSLYADGSDTGYYNGWIWASKSAVRHPSVFKRRLNWLWSPQSEQIPTYVTSPLLNVTPVKIDAGETLFYPSDVVVPAVFGAAVPPAFGAAMWDSNDAPGLPYP